MFPDAFIRGLGALDGTFLQVVPRLPALFQCRSDAVASFGDFFPGHVCGCGEQGPRVILESLKFVSDSIFFRDGISSSRVQVDW